MEDVAATRGIDGLDVVERWALYEPAVRVDHRAFRAHRATHDFRPVFGEDFEGVLQIFALCPAPRKRLGGYQNVGVRKKLGDAVAHCARVEIHKHAALPRFLCGGKRADGVVPVYVQNLRLCDEVERNVGRFQFGGVAALPRNAALARGLVNPAVGDGGGFAASDDHRLCGDFFRLEVG